MTYKAIRLSLMGVAGYNTLIKVDAQAPIHTL